MLFQTAPEPQSTPLMAGKVQGGKYIPPARRGAGSSASGGSGSGGSGSDNPIIVTSSAKRKPKVAPNLRSESDFPTLGGPTADSWVYLADTGLTLITGFFPGYPINKVSMVIN